MKNNPDMRNITTGLEIPTITYSDQPYIVKTEDGAWLCCVTTGVGREGEPGQIVTTMRSIDQGYSWSPRSRLNRRTGPKPVGRLAQNTQRADLYFLCARIPR